MAPIRPSKNTVKMPRKPGTSPPSMLASLAGATWVGSPIMTLSVPCSPPSFFSPPNRSGTSMLICWLEVTLPLKAVLPAACHSTSSLTGPRPMPT
ncbi:hypothetical protein D9M68_621840 [compost metagenome]